MGTGGGGWEDAQRDEKYNACASIPTYCHVMRLVPRDNWVASKQLSIQSNSYIRAHPGIPCVSIPFAALLFGHCLDLSFNSKGRPTYKDYLKRSSPLENCCSRNKKIPCWCWNIFPLVHTDILHPSMLEIFSGL